MVKATDRPAVKLGGTYATPGVMEEYGPFILGCLGRHHCADWGDVCQEDAEANESALVHGERLLSVYNMPDGGKIWIITEADRSATTVLLPSEY